MVIELIEFTKGYEIPEDGKYLVRSVLISPIKQVIYLEAMCYRVFNGKTKKFETTIDVGNQVVTHISKTKLIKE